MNQTMPFMPFPMFQMPVQQQQQPVDLPPARVRVALELLGQLSFKTMTRAAVSENQIQEIEGTKLTTAEANAQASAANMLIDYFAGNLHMDVYEAINVGPKEPGTLVGCFLCINRQGQPNDGPCRLCRGTGMLLVYPGGEGK